jgi:hypothetical protein
MVDCLTRFSSAAIHTFVFFDKTHSNYGGHSPPYNSLIMLEGREARRPESLEGLRPSNTSANYFFSFPLSPLLYALCSANFYPIAQRSSNEMLLKRSAHLLRLPASRLRRVGCAHRNYSFPMASSKVISQPAPHSRS